MQPSTLSQSELLQPTTRSVSPAISVVFGRSPAPTTRGASIITFEQRVVHAPLPAGYTEIDDLIKKHQGDPRKAKALARARQRLAGVLEASAPTTLSTLRLRRGLSQAALAELIGNSQPSYSKIEAGRVDVLYSTFEKLVAALGVSRDELAGALRNTVEQHK